MDPMTYKEIKKRLVQCEYTLNCLKDGSYKNLEPAEIQAKTEKLTTLKENLLKKLDVLKEAVEFEDEREAAEFADKNPDTPVKIVKEAEFDNKAMSAIAIETGKAVAKSLKEVGDEVARMKAKRIETNSFDIHVTYKGEGRDDEFSFYIDPKDDTLHLVDFSFDQKLVDIGEKPSGEPLVNVDLLTNELVKHFSKDIVNEGYYDNYEPKHFDICPGATALRDRLVAGEFGKQEPVVVGKWTELHDDLFRLEKRVIEKNYAQDAHARTANDLRDEIIHLSRDLNIPASEIGYLKGHVNKIIDIGIKSGGIREVVDDKDTEALKKLSQDLKGSSQAHLDQKKKLDKIIQTEGEGDDHHYIKVPRRDFKKAEAIIAQNIDGNNVKMDYVDNDGAGNAIIYFDFKSDDIISGEADSFMYDAVMDLEAHGIRLSDHSAELDENVTQKHIDDIEASGNIDIAYKKAMELLKSMIAKNEAVDHNDPVLIKMRAAKMKRDRFAGSDPKAGSTIKSTGFDPIILKLKAKRAQIMRDMEQEAEPEGGPIANKYGDMLNKIDAAIAKARGQKTMTYHQAIAEDEEETDYVKRRREEDDYYEDPDYYKEDVDVGHQDDEPSMLKNTAYESATYAAKLYKKLAKYDQHDGEVDFPNWWQSKLILAKDYLSKAFHYLDSEEKQPMLDKLALEGTVKERLVKGFNPGEKYFLPDDGYMAAKLRAEDEWYTPYEGTDADGETTADRAHHTIRYQMGVKDPEKIKKFIAGWEKYTRDVLDGKIKLVQNPDNAPSDEPSKNNVVWDWSGDRNELEQVPPKFKAAVRAGLGDQINDEDFEDAFDGIKNFFADEAGRGEMKFNSDDWIDMIEMDYLNESVNEGTELYDKNGMQFKRFAGPNGLAMQITTRKLKGGGFDYIQIDGSRLGEFISALAKSIRVFDDLKRQTPVDEALDSDLPKGKHSIAKLQKVHGMIIDKMKELAKLYKEEGPDHEYNGHPVIDHLKSLTSKKKKVEAALDKAVSDKGRGQELDPNINEISEYEVEDAIAELGDIIRTIDDKADEAREIVRQVFPDELSRLDAYGAFNMTYSNNRYDVTLGKFVERLEEEGFEIDDDGDVITLEGMKEEDRDNPYTDYRDNSDGTWDAPKDYVHNIWRDVSIYGLDSATKKKNKAELIDAIEKFGYKYEVWKDEDIYYYVDGRTRPKKEDAEKIDQIQDKHAKQERADFDARRKSSKKVKPQKLSKLTKGGNTYKVGEDDPNDDGTITSIEKYPNGYFINGVVYGDDDGDKYEKEGYGYAIDLDGNEMPEEDLEGMYEGKYKSDAQRKAIYAAKAEKEKKNEAIDLVHVYRDGEIFGTGELVKDLGNGKVRVRFDGSSVGTFHSKNVKPVKEAAPGFKHDCASKVIHKEHGVGICIPEKHTLIKEGNKYVVTHYDVLFKEGKKVVEDIPVEELQIVTQKEHWHKGYKKKKK